MIEQEISLLRSRMKWERRTLPIDELYAASQAVCRQVIVSEAFSRAKTVMGYIAVRGEINVGGILEAAHAQGKRVLLPRCADGGVMTAHYVTASDDLVPGTWAIPEPKEDCEQGIPEEIDLILVPGVVYDRSGHRIGQGGGYYDRFLPGTKGFRLGICHLDALREEIPFREHDCLMHALVTPEEWIDCQTERTENT